MINEFQHWRNLQKSYENMRKRALDKIKKERERIARYENSEETKEFQLQEWMSEMELQPIKRDIKLHTTFRHSI